jgi:hypothetical protein
MLTRSLVRPVTIVLTVAGVILLALAVLYLSTKASALPSFIPGHLPRRIGKTGHVIPTHAHTKLGLVLLVGSVIALAGAWWVAFRYEPVD